MEEKRILLIGGVGLVKTRIRGAGAIMVEICDELEPLLKKEGFVTSAPFKTVSLVLRYGGETNLTPDYDPINKHYAELPVAVELEAAGLQSKSKEELKKIFFETTLYVLIDIAKKYNLPYQQLEEL